MRNRAPSVLVRMQLLYGAVDNEFLVVEAATDHSVQIATTLRGLLGILSFLVF